MTSDVSELTALEKSKTSTPTVIQQEHYLAHDENPSAVEETDGIRYRSSLDKGTSRALSSGNNVNYFRFVLF